MMDKRQLHLFPDGSNQATNKPELASSKVKGYISSIWVFPEDGGFQPYRWYGTLPRPLVERLISLYACNERSRILDPFMGTGTTLEVAAEANLRGTGIDSNPLACLIAETKLARTIPTHLTTGIASEVAKNAFKSLEVHAASDWSWPEALDDKRFEYTKKWFRKDTLNALLNLFLEIAEVEDEQIQRLLFVAAAQVVRDVASVDSRCTHHLVTKKKGFVNPTTLWKEKVANIVKAGRRTSVDLSRIVIRQGSVFEPTLELDSAEFALIHPPYLGMIHYHLMHRLATDLLDVVNMMKSPASLKKYDFNYERIRKVDVSTDSSNEYNLFVKKLTEKLQKIVVSSGCCAVIIGDQRYKGHLRHPFTEFIKGFETSGFDLEENFIWILENNAGMHILRRGHFIDHNYILIFRKR